VAEYNKEIQIGRSSRTVTFQDRKMVFSRPIFSKGVFSSGKTATYELLYSDIISAKKSLNGITFKCKDGRNYSIYGRSVKDSIGMFVAVLKDNEKKI
jgi:hypothetical protein